VTRRSFAVTVLLQLAVLAVAVYAWWLATDVFPGPESIAHGFSPEEAFPALVRLIGDGRLVDDAATSLLRLVLGLGLAAVIGVPAGLLIGTVALARRATGALLHLLRMTSPLSWAPIAVIAFGVGSAPVVALIVAAAVWPLVLNTASGVRAVDADWLLTARSLGAGRGELLRSVVLPAVRPHVLTGLRVALGISWIVLVPAEMLGVQSGLGYAVLNARDQLAYDELMATVVAIGILGFLLDLGAQALLRERRARRRPVEEAPVDDGIVGERVVA
jgi:NitT/TauT family transport system permease protein